MKKIIKHKSIPIATHRILSLILMDALSVGLLVISGILIYSNTFHNPFVFDDINFITINNPHLHMTRLSWESIKEAAFDAQPGHRFLPKISFALNYYFGGENTSGYHLFNLVIHVLTGIILFLFVKSTVSITASHIVSAGFLRDADSKKTAVLTLISFSAALIWLVHPVQTNAVTYMCQRMTGMVAMFYMLCLLCYTRGRIRWRAGDKKCAAAFFAGCLIFGGCSAASKENAGMLPVFILLYEWYFFQDLRDIRTYRTLSWILFGCIIFLAVAVMYLGQDPIQTILSTYATREFTLPQRVLTEFRVIAYYLSLLIFPYPGRLHLDYDYPLSYSLITPPTTIISMAMIIALLAAAVYLAKKDRLISFCILWFLGNLVIESSVAGIEIIFEHRLYLPSMMIFLMLTLLVFRLVKSYRMSSMGLIAIAMLLSIWSFQRNIIWKSDVSFWTDNAVKSPNKARPYQNLAYSYQRDKDFKDAIDNYRKSIRIKPHPVAYFNLGLALQIEKNYLEAVEAFLNALKMGYNTPQVQINLGQCLSNIGEFQDAIMHFNMAEKMDPNDPLIRKNLQKLQQFLQSCPEPAACVQKLIDQQPDNIALYYKLGAVYERQGNADKAKIAYQTVLDRLGPSDSILYILTINRLGMLYSAVGDTSDAIALFKKGVKAAPDEPHLYYQIAVVYAGLNDAKTAVSWLDEAVKRGFSDWPEIEKDARWDSIRDTPYYQQLEQRFK